MKRSVQSDWTGVALICGKCSKKMLGGFGEDGCLSLAKALRRIVGSGGGGKGRRAAFGIVEVKCLGVCPRQAVVVIGAARPGEWMLVRPDDDLLALASRLTRADQA